MHYIGIDMSKDNFHAAFENEKVLIFENARVGIGEFIEILIQKNLKKQDTLIGTEATGVYHLLLERSPKSWTHFSLISRVK